MPYVPGAGVHGVVHVADVYNTNNVFINDVPVALWLTPGGSSQFVGVEISSSLTIDAGPQVAIAAQTEALISAQIANPTGPNQFYSSTATNDGVKGNYAPIEDATTSTGTISLTTSSSDIVPFLTQALNDASNGLWRETGQGGAPSNVNITNIWKNLGYPQSGPWLSDQTAWCMGFVNFALKCSGYKFVQTASAAAITTNPERWGAVQVPKDQAQPGDIAFWSYRHVNFVYSADGGKYTFVGGNQSPKASNNPNDGDVTKSYPGGTGPTNPNWVSCWRPTKNP